MYLIYLLFVACAFGLGNVNAACSEEEYDSCIEAIDADFFFNEEDFTSDLCPSNFTKEDLDSAKAEVDNCIDTYLGDCQDEYHLETLHAEAVFQFQYIAQTISDECDLDAGPYCEAYVLNCILKDVDIDVYDGADSSENTTDHEDIMNFLGSNVEDEDEYSDFCLLRSEDETSNFPQALECINGLQTPCEVDLTKLLSSVESYYEAMALTFQLQYFACSDGCKNPDLPERLSNLENCRTGNSIINSLTTDAVNQALQNDTTKVEYCTAANDYIECIETTSKGCAYTTRLVLEELGSNSNFVLALETLLTADNCPDTKDFTEVENTLNELDSEASNITGKGTILKFGLGTMLLTLIIAMVIP